jgi:hypothetical protein
MSAQDGKDASSMTWWRDGCHSGGIFFQPSTVRDNKKDASSMTG